MSEPIPYLPLVHAFATLALVGLIWTIQLVHYPLMALVGPTEFARYVAAHARRITPLVGSLMLVELGCALLLVVPGALPVSQARFEWMPWVGLAAVGVVWVTTAFVSVPCHAVLARGFDPHALRRLVRTNWIRTATWSFRGVLALAILEP